MASSAVTVGCAVGVPAGIIIIICLVFWIRNERIQKRQDREQVEFDEEIRLDNALFADVQQEIIAVRNNPNNDNNKILKAPFDEKLKLLALEVTSDVPDTSSSLAADHDRTPSSSGRNENTGSHHTNNQIQNPAQSGIITASVDERTLSSTSSLAAQGTTPTTPLQLNRYSNANHGTGAARTPSSYSFFDQVIPVLQQPAPVGSIQSKNSSASLVNTPGIESGDNVNFNNAGYNGNNGDTTTTNNNNNTTHNNTLINGSSVAGSGPGLGHGSGPGSGSGSGVFGYNDPGYSLETLAKQLAQPSYFDKLPKGVVPPSSSAARRLQYLSHQLLAVDLTNSNEKDVPIGKVLGGQFAHGFSEDSPFGGPEVVYK